MIWPLWTAKVITYGLVGVSIGMVAVSLWIIWNSRWDDDDVGH